MNIFAKRTQMTNTNNASALIYSPGGVGEVSCQMAARRKRNIFHYPEKLKTWFSELVGFGFNHAGQNHAGHAENKQPIKCAEILAEHSLSDVADSQEQQSAIPKHSVLWQALDEIDDTYRELLSLFNQELHSIKPVADVDDELKGSLPTDELRLKIENLSTIRQTLRRNYAQSTHKDVEPVKPESALSDRELSFVERFNGVIEANYRDSEFNVSACAFALNVSERQLSRKLNTLVGERFNERLRDHRLEQSIVLFASDMPISQICYEVGFSGPSYFAACFRTKFGKTPSQYQSEVATCQAMVH